MKPINLSELIDALESDGDEAATRVDLQNGCVISVDQRLLRSQNQ